MAFKSKLKILFFSLALVLPCHMLFADNYSVYIEPGFLYTYEHFTEDLYDVPAKLNSRLEWNADYLFKAGTGVFVKDGNLRFNSSLYFNLPLNCGIVYDSDWYTKGIKTNLSKGELWSGFGFELSFKLAYELKLDKSFSLLPHIAFTNNYKKYGIKNNIGWCGDVRHTGLSENIWWNDERAKKVRKYGIDLFYNSTNIFVGLGFESRINDFLFGGGVSFSPYSYLLCIDHHLGKTGGSYSQITQKAFWYKADVEFAYEFTDKSLLHLAGSYVVCPKSRATFYYGHFFTDHIIADEYEIISLKNLSVQIIYSHKLK
ncbi:MAG: hypothetical protein K5907_03470 [Treponema sp.]|nr:hypothetical protein [Treponema sp.]